MDLFIKDILNENPLQAENYVYGLEGFVKEDSNFYFLITSIQVNTYISLINITPESIACSCINCVFEDITLNNKYTITLWIIIFRFCEESKFQNSILEVLKKKNVFKKDLNEVLSSAIFFFESRYFNNLNKKAYKAILLFLEIPTDEVNELLNQCSDQLSFDPLIIFLEKYKLLF